MYTRKVVGPDGGPLPPPPEAYDAAASTVVTDLSAKTAAGHLSASTVVEDLSAMTAAGHLLQRVGEKSKL